MTLSGIATVARKDTSEWLSDRDSRRGFVVQSAILIAMLGAFVPWTTPSIWSSPGEAALLYVVFPSLISSMLAADAFAGEKERRTLESLLATPLTDGELFLGKVIAAAGLSTADSIVTITVSFLTLLVRAHSKPAILPAGEQCAFLILGAFGAALLISALAVAVSARVNVARSAQQIVQVIFLLLNGLVALLLKSYGAELTWQSAGIVCAALLVVGSILVGLSKLLFSRERLIAKL